MRERKYHPQWKLTAFCSVKHHYLAIAACRQLGDNAQPFVSQEQNLRNQKKPAGAIFEIRQPNPIGQSRGNVSC